MTLRHIETNKPIQLTKMYGVLPTHTNVILTTELDHGKEFQHTSTICSHSQSCSVAYRPGHTNIVTVVSAGYVY
jgi:hypothetical protein